MFKKVLYCIVVLVIGIIAGITGTLLAQKFTGPKQTVNITGQGVVEAPADQATISLTVQNSSWSQDQAEKDNKQEVQDLKDRLISLGIPQSRITESSYSTMPIPMMIPGQPVPPTAINENIFPVPPISGNKNPTAVTSLSITLDALAGIDKLFAVINTSPHAKITSTNYSLTTSATYEAKAREKAIQDARSQVEAIAKINNLHVGKLVSLTNIGSLVPMYKQAMMGGAAQADSNTSVSYGEKTLTITASFNATYELY